MARCDNHRHSLAASYQVVHDVLHVALTAPARLVLAHAVLQVQDGVLLLALLVLGRRVNHRMTPLTGALCKVIDAAYLTCRDVSLRTIVVAFRAFGNLDAARLAAASEEGFCGGVNEADAVHLHEVVVEAHDKRVGDCHEAALAVGLHLVLLVADIDDDLASLRCLDAEVGTPFLVHLREVVAGHGGLAGESVSRHLNCRL